MKIKQFLHILTLSLLFSSCGVLIESSKFVGKWGLSSVDFYVYNAELDSYKTISSTDSVNDTIKSIYKGRFFFDTKLSHKIEFKDKGSGDKSQFTITNGSGTLVPFSNGEWSIDSYENFLILQTLYQDTTLDNPWLKGIKIKNYWPLLKNNSKDVLEIYIDSNDLGLDNFKFDISSDTISIRSMKATFVKE